MKRRRTSALERDLAEARSARTAAERPLFEPWERLQMLTNQADDIPNTAHGNAVREILLAATTVVRQFQGTATRAAAYAQVRRAGAAIRRLVPKESR